MNEFAKLNFLSCGYHVIKGLKTSDRIVCDYELDYHYCGKIVQCIDGKYYNIDKDSVVFRRPGQIVRSDGDYMCRTLTFDLSGKGQAHYEKIPRIISKKIQETGETPLLDCIPTVFTPQHTKDLIAILEMIEACARYFCESNNEKQKILNSATLELLLLLCSDAIHSTSKMIVPVNSIVNIVCRYIECNYMNALNIHDFENLVHVSGDHLIRIFKREIGTTPISYLISVRLYNARFMLEHTDFKIDEVSAECGFNNTAYFIKRFRTAYGLTPRQYRLTLRHLV